ncbi:MAG: NADH:ubiquinone reductase (Na(+)-transporting) subunit C [Pseudomonadales bacterium]
MSRDGDSPLRTLLVATLVALGCSALVATAVQLLRPVQDAWALLERNRAIVAAAGADAADMSEREVISAYLDLDVHLVDLDAAAPAPAAAVGDVRSYDHWALGDEADSALLRQARAGLPGPPPYARYVPIYLVLQDGRLQRAVLPFHGPGMWSTLYGYLALQADLNHVASLVIYRHGETPGIGDRIEDPGWLASWHGKRVYDAQGQVRLDVTRSPSAPDYDVDIISGASITSNALGEAIRAWLGPQGYGPLLARWRRGELATELPGGGTES